MARRRKEAETGQMPPAAATADSLVHLCHPHRPCTYYVYVGVIAGANDSLKR